jgi:hypothetical protein
VSEDRSEGVLKRSEDGEEGGCPSIKKRKQVKRAETAGCVRDLESYAEG